MATDVEKLEEIELIKKQEVKTQDDLIQRTKKLSKAREELSVITGLTIEEVKELEAATAKLGEKLKEQKNIISNFNKELLDSIPIVGKWGQSFRNLGKQLDGLSGTQKAYKLGIIGLQASVVAATTSTINMALEIDRSTVGFRRATGMTGKFDDNIHRLTFSMRGYGVSSREAAEATQSLFTNVSDFVFMSEDQQDVLGETVSILNELGYSAATSTKAIQFQMKVFGKNVKGAEKSQREMLQLARDLGVPVEQLGQDFNAMAPALAALGRDGTRAFRDLEAAAKATGIPAQRLLSIVSQFDTFEGAAGAVGKLNAILGGPFLNSMEMVSTTDPTERLRLMKGALDDAGKSFEDMEYYESKAIASAMGLQDVSELAFLMAGRQDLMAGKTAKSTEELIALKEQTKDFNTVMEEAAEVGRMLAVSLGPVISALKSMLQWLQKSGLVEGFGKLIAVISPFLIALAYMGSLINPITAIIGGLVTTVIMLVTAFEMLGHTFTVGASPPLLSTLSAANKEMDALAKTTDAINKNGISGTNIAATSSLAATTAMAKQVEGITASITSGRGDVYLDGRVIGEVIDKGAKSTLENGMRSSYS